MSFTRLLTRMPPNWWYLVNRKSFNLSNKLLPVTPGRRSGTPTDASLVMAIHRLMLSAIHIGDDSDWSVYSLMLSMILEFTNAQM